MKKIFFVTLSLLALSLAGAGQEYKTFRSELEGVRNTRLRFGPFRFVPTLQLRDLGYDDNVYYRSAGEALIGDYSGAISPAIKAYFPVGNSLLLSFRENPEYVYYFKEENLRAFTNSFAPAVRINLFKRFTLSGEYHFEKHQRRAYSEFAGNVTDTVKGYTASFFFETPRGSALGFTGKIDRFGYEDDQNQYTVLSRAMNRKESTANAELYYRAFSESDLFFVFGYTKYEFDDPEFWVRDAHSYQTSWGIRFPLTGRARGKLSLGYKNFIPELEGRKRFSGLIADSSVDIKLGRFDVRLGLNRNTVFSYLEGSYYYIDSRANAGLSLYLTRLFRLDYDYQSGGMKYPEPFEIQVPGGPPELIMRKDTYGMHSAGLTVRLFRTTGISLSYNVFDRKSNASGFDIRRNFVGLSLTQSF
ncbi:MAG: outer membrane beta-barrel protein [Candidatus Aminicenantales bacterium]